MSVESISWALNVTDDRLTAVDRLVLIGIANHDGDGGAWPSVATLARYAGVAERSIGRSLARLEQIGYVTRHVQQGGTAKMRAGQRPNLYELHRTPDPPVTPDRTVTPPPTEVSGVPPTDGSPEPSIEPSTQPSIATGTSDFEHISEVELLCLEMADAIANWSNDKRPTVGEGWKQDMDRLIRIDGRTPNQVSRVIRWLYTSSDEVATFWAPNIQSPKKLRAKWVQMAKQYERLGRSSTAHKSSIQQDLDRIRERDAS